MTDPKRWLDDDPSLSEEERGALEAGRAIAPPAETREVLFASILATLQLPTGTGGGGGTDGGIGTAAAAGGAAKTGAVAGAAKTAAAAGAAAGGKAVSSVGVAAVIKSFVVGSGLAVAAIVGHEVVTTRAREPSPPPAVTTTYDLSASPSAIVTQTPATVLSALAPVPSATVEPMRLSAAPSAVASSPESTPPEPAAAAPPAVEPATVDTALQESRLVARARAQVRTGRGAEALATLEEANRTIPRGVLGQEREALAIEALALSGRRGEAQARARAFLDRFPNSPHGAQVSAFAEPPR